MIRLGYLGPPGTFSEEALHTSGQTADAELVHFASIQQTIMAVHERAVDRALVPIENALEGGVNATLDTLAADVADVVIVGEHDLAIRNCLIARRELADAAIEVVVSHPQPLGQCARFLREHLPHATVRTSSSTAEAVREVAERGDEPWAALGPRTAAQLYGCRVLHDGVDDDPDNVTRFVWLAPRGAAPLPAVEGRAWKTSIVFTGAGDGQPGWLVRCLSEFAFRGVNLTKIESRPHRGRLGSYVFHVDVEGREDDDAVTDALSGLHGHCEMVRTLGSYPAG